MDPCVRPSHAWPSLMHCFLPFQFMVIVYNPLARPVNWNIRLPVNGSLYSIVAPSGQAVLNKVGGRQPLFPGQLGHLSSGLKQALLSSMLPHSG